MARALWCLDRVGSPDVRAGDREITPSDVADLLLMALKNEDSEALEGEKDHLYDAIRFLEDMERNPELADQFRAQARASLRRFGVKPEISQGLGRVRGPILETPELRELYGFFLRHTRGTYKEVGDYLRVSKSTVKRRIEPLLERGLIRKFEPETPGQPTEFILV